VAIEVSGDIDLSSAATLHQLLEREADGRRDVVLDLSRVTLLDSTGLAVLFGAAKRAARRGTVFALRINASEPVMQVLDETQTRDRFVWVADDDDDGRTRVREPRRPGPSRDGGNA
jgi:anti-anti-sigma factor